jgi:hypothetical protein
MRLQFTGGWSWLSDDDLLVAACCMPDRRETRVLPAMLFGLLGSNDEWGRLRGRFWVVKSV